MGNSETVVQSGLTFSVVTERPTVKNVVNPLLIMIFEEITAWRSTTALPMLEPGLLELVVDIDTRPR